MFNIAFIDDDPVFRDAILASSALCLNPVVLASVEECLVWVANNSEGIVVSDLRMPNSEDGVLVLEQVRRIAPRARLFILTGFRPNATEHKRLRDIGASVFSKIGEFDTLLEVIKIESGITPSFEEKSGAHIRSEAENRKSVEIDFQSIPVGPDYASTFHHAVFEYLKEIFEPPLRYFKIEQEIHEGRKRIDIVATNSTQGGFFSDILTLHRLHAPIIPIECKNYGREIGNPELDQLAGRFSDQRGKFGLLIYRRVANEERLLARCRDFSRQKKEYILPLDDFDLTTMMELHRNGRHSMIDEILHSKFFELIRD